MTTETTTRERRHRLPDTIEAGGLVFVRQLPAGWYDALYEYEDVVAGGYVIVQRQAFLDAGKARFQACVQYCALSLVDPRWFGTLREAATAAAAIEVERVDACGLRWVVTTGGASTMGVKWSDLKRGLKEVSCWVRRARGGWKWVCRGLDDRRSEGVAATQGEAMAAAAAASATRGGIEQ